MLNKEEIENKIKPIGEMLQDKINRLSEENFRQSQYIEQLESDKQKLIEKLEKYIKLINCGETLSIRSTLKEILEIVKGVEK